MKKSFTVALLLSIFFTACSEKNDKPLEFDSDTCGVAAGYDRYVTIKSGNGSYTVYSEDDSVVLAGYTKTEKKSAGHILLTGKKTGQTWVKVTDNATKEEVRLKVYVTEPYFTIFGDAPKAVTELESEFQDNNASLEKSLLSEYPFGENHYMFHLMKGTGVVRIDERPGLNTSTFYEGTYSLTRNEDNFILDVVFERSGETVSKEYIITGNEDIGYLLLVDFFENREITSVAHRKTRESPVEYRLEITEDLTEKYSSEYPGLIYAGTKAYPQVSANGWMNDGFFN